MSKRSIILFVVLFLVIVAGMFTFAYLKRSELAGSIPPPPTAGPTATTTPYRFVVDAKHYRANGLHTFVGVVDLPTPCHLLEASALVAESFPEQIVINFTVINNAEVCTQVVTPQRFKVEAAASADATIVATWDGQPIQLNLIPAAPGERPEDFELFIKG